MIREEYGLTSWRKWSALVADAVRRFTARHGAPDLIALSPAMHRRMSVATCAGGRYAPLRGLGTAGGVVLVVVEDDAADGAFALVRADRAPTERRAA
jgi:hypothetical protein